MNTAVAVSSLVKIQVQAQIRTFFRIPVAAFFTLVLPIVMLVLINALVANGTVETANGAWKTSHFITVGLAAFAAVSATYTNFANIIPVRRDQGVLKRWRSTPLPSWAYVAGMLGSSVVIALTGVIAILGLGVAAYGLEIQTAKLPAAFAVLTMGIITFSALGIAIGSMIPSPAAAPAIANGTILPLAFISNIFLPLENPPVWVDWLGAIFPLRSFVTSLQDAFNPTVEAAGMPWGSLLWMAVWAGIGIMGSVRYFTWEPKSRRNGAANNRARR